ncbi:MAG: VOC family protein [Methanomicrobiales archaeon]|nr:VOC family protein [Methanomicrobiales archaeon]
MSGDLILLDHIALHVTSLERSIRFYKDILQMEVFGPVNLGTLTASGQIINKAVSGRHVLLKGIINSISTRAIRDQYTDIALISPDGSGYCILLIEERTPETNQTKSIDGLTIFGFSCNLAPSVDMDILGWDLYQKEATFEWGDPESDGTLFSENVIHHSLYVRDPDGRTIELKTKDAPISAVAFSSGPDTITLHVTYPEKSRDFYTEKLDFSVDSDSGSSIPGKRYIWLKDKSGKKCILLLGRTTPDGNPVKTGGYGLDHFALKGTGIKGEKSGVCLDIRMNPDCLSEKTGSSYLGDPDGYWVECCQ